jgi:RNA polymerase sigma-70 factor (ECF subfamily)
LGWTLTVGSARSSRLLVVPPLRSDRQRWYVGEMAREPVSDEPLFAQQLLGQAGTLYNFARYLCRDAARAEDLVQDTFARALDAEAQFAPGSNLKAWLFRILRNTYVDGRRRDRRSPVALRGGVEDDVQEPVAPEVWLRGDVEIDRLRSLVARDIESALSRLSDDARAVILLDLEGCTETEIASVMDVAVGTVKSRLARARAVLREQLQEYAK